MRKILMLPILLVLILFVAVQTAYSASLPTLTYYEAANQFTTNSNPNGTWTYGYNEAGWFIHALHDQRKFGRRRRLVWLHSGKHSAAGEPVRPPGYTVADLSSRSQR